MATATIPLSPQDQMNVDFLLQDRHIAGNKADVFRYAVRVLAEQESIREILESVQEAKSGKVLYGDIDVLAKKLRI